MNQDILIINCTFKDLKNHLSNLKKQGVFKYKEKNNTIEINIINPNKNKNKITENINQYFYCFDLFCLKEKESEEKRSLYISYSEKMTNEQKNQMIKNIIDLSNNNIGFSFYFSFISKIKIMKKVNDFLFKNNLLFYKVFFVSTKTIK